MVSENWHALTVGAVEHILKVNANEGLSGDEAKHRLDEFGPNELIEEAKITPFQILFGQFKSILVLVLLGAAFVSGFILEEFADMILIMIILIGNAILGFVQEYRAEKAVEALKKMIAPTARVRRGGKEMLIPSKDVVPGEILVLEEGDRITADARVIKVVSLNTDEAPLTGESRPIAKRIEPLLEEVQLADRTNMIYMGTHVAYGRGEALAISTGMNTEFGKIAQLVQEVEEATPPLKQKMEQLGRQLVIISASLCVVCFTIGILAGRDIVFMFLVAVSMAVSAIPEGLPAVLTITLALGVNRLAKQKAIVRKLASVETLGCVSVICSDKTGTLTQNELTVAKLYTNGQIIDITGAGYAPEGDFLQNGVKFEPQKDNHTTLLLRIGSLCSNASIHKSEEGWQVLGDPTEGALVIAAAKADLWMDKLHTQYPRVWENPFDSVRKRMSTIHNGVNGKLVYLKGAPEIILERCDRIIENNTVRRLTNRDRNRILDTAQQLAGEALRLLAMAYKEIPMASQNYEPDQVEYGLVFVGIEGMIDPPRDEVPLAIQQCRHAGIKVIMVTGDHKLTAIAIAKQIGLFQNHEENALTGADLDTMSAQDLDKIVNEVVVFARVSPEHKLQIAQSLKRTGHIIAMTGDGVNDAPTIKAADIGVAMGIKGTDVTKEAADLILEDDNFATIVTAIRGGRHIYENIKKYCRSLISANFDEFMEILLATIAMIPLTLLPIQILYLNLMSDGIPAVALSMDPEEEGLMDRPPRDPKESLLKPMWMYVPFCATIDYITDMIPFTFILTAGYTYWGPWAAHDPRLLLARTEDLLSITFYEILLSYVSRSEDKPLIKQGWKGFTQNKLMLFAWLLSWGASLFIIYTPPLAEIMHLEALPLFWVGITMIDALSAFIIWPKKLLYREVNRRNIVLIFGWMGGAALTIVSTILIHRSFDVISWIGLIIMSISILMIYDIIPIGKKTEKATRKTLQFSRTHAS